jgi:hypothetical protein
VRKRKDRRAALLARLLALAALAVSAALLWRWVATTPPDIAPSPLPIAAAPNSQPAEPGEDFSAAERRRLDDILRQKSGAARR